MTAGAHLHGLLAPIRHRCFFLAEHTLTGAGCIDEYPVKVAFIFVCQALGRFIGHKGIGNAHALNIPAEDPGPLRVDLIAQQKAFPIHPSGNLGSLATGCGTQITNPLAGLGIQQCHC